MRFRDGNATQRLNTDEAYDRFFDGYFNLERPGEILERNVVLSRPKVEIVKAPVRPTNRRIVRSTRSTGSKAGVK